MKKLFIALIIAVVLILGIYGSVALAAPPGATPLEIWEQILARIGDPTLTTQGWDTVSEALEDIDSSIDGISTDIGDQTTDLTDAIDGVQTSVDSLAEKVDNQAVNMTKTVFIHDIVGASEDTYVFALTDTDIELFTQKHIHLTLELRSVDPGEKVVVGYSRNSADYTWVWGDYEELGADGRYTFEFEATSFSISTLDVADHVTIAYSMMVTYMP